MMTKNKTLPAISLRGLVVFPSMVLHFDVGRERSVNALKAATDGDGLIFLVAQKDLELRGPGDLMGTRQSGEMMADFLLDGDVRLLEEAANCMKRLRTDAALQTEREAVEQTALAQYGDRLSKVALN